MTTPAQPKVSCRYCRHLSEVQHVRFGPGMEEMRQICLRGHWEHGSVLVTTILSCPGRFWERAEKCGEFVHWAKPT